MWNDWLARVLQKPTVTFVAQDSILSPTLFAITCVHSAHYDDEKWSLDSFLQFLPGLKSSRFGFQNKKWME
jgi:hypothetical protein